jgi:hypothetical protein
MLMYLSWRIIFQIFKIVCTLFILRSSLPRASCRYASMKFQFINKHIIPDMCNWRERDSFQLRLSKWVRRNSRELAEEFPSTIHQTGRARVWLNEINWTWNNIDKPQRYCLNCRFAQIVLNRSQLTWPLRHFLPHIIVPSHSKWTHIKSRMECFFSASRERFLWSVAWCSSIFVFEGEKKNWGRVSNRSIKQVKWVSVAWRILKAYFNQQGVNSLSKPSLAIVQRALSGHFLLCSLLISALFCTFSCSPSDRCEDMEGFWGS